MRAFLLAGGRGERLRPLTDSLPKCLVRINGQPLLGIWLDACLSAGISRVLLNVSHHADQVCEYLACRKGLPSVEVVVEKEPLGTARTVAENRSFVAGEESFWILYADNLTDFHLVDMVATHRRHDAVLTMALFHAPVPSAAGIVQMDEHGRIVSFEEKPKAPPSDLANAGLYLARAALFDELRPDIQGPFDFGFHVLPRLVGKMYGHVIEGFFLDIGTPTALERASETWRSEREGAVQ